MRRTSNIPTKRVRTYGPAEAVSIRCISCAAPLHSGMHYTGTVTEGEQFRTIISQETLPVTGTIHTWDKSYVIGGEVLETRRKVAFLTKRKGPLCDGCAADIRTFLYHGQRVQRVITDPRPGYIGITIVPVIETL